MFKTLPTEIIATIFENINDIRSFQNIKFVSKDFNDIMNFSQKIKIRCLMLVNILSNYNSQLKIFNEELISNNKPKHTSMKKIKQDDIKNYIDCIMGCSNSEELKNLFTNFKEDVIDAISDCESKHLISQYDLTNLRQTKKTEFFRMDDILEKAVNRIRGDIFLYPNGVQITGTFDIDDKWGRRYGDYGTSGGLQPSVGIWITSNQSDNWSRHGHPDFGGIDEHLPYEMFLGKKEGDSISFVFKEREIKLTLKQDQYRYGCCRYDKPMPFEDMTKSVLGSSGGICSGSYYTPPLSEEEQRNMLTDAYEKYAASIK